MTKGSFRWNLKCLFKLHIPLPDPPLHTFIFWGFVVTKSETSHPKDLTLFIDDPFSNKSHKPHYVELNVTFNSKFLCQFWYFDEDLNFQLKWIIAGSRFDGSCFTELQGSVCYSTRTRRTGRSKTLSACRRDKVNKLIVR